MSKQYWAAKPINEIAKEVEKQYEEYQDFCRRSGYRDRQNAAYSAYYNINQDGSIRLTKNDDGVVQIKVNHYRSLIRRLHILVTENKLAFQPRARNSDTKSQIESDLAKGIAEYYSDEKNMHGVLSDAVKGALIELEQFVHAPWDLAEGYELTTDGSQTIKSGDQKFELCGPKDVAKSKSIETPFYIVRKKVNKYDQAALYPDFANEILSSSIEKDHEDAFSSFDEDEDMTHKFILYHARTPAMPFGRHTEIIAGQVLADDELKYDKMPVFRISAGDVMHTVFGDSPAIDLLPLQDALDRLMSATTTNNMNNSVQLLYSSDPNLTTSKLSDGQTLVTASSPPQALNLTGSASENYKMIDLLVSHQQLLSGVNDTARGNPSASLKSGTSLAVMIAQAIQFVSDLQKSYARLASDVGSCLINNIQKFASEEMTAYISGSSRKGYIRKFKAKDLMNVERITVDLGNPLTQSFAGRSELIQTWQQYGIVKDPKQVVSFLRTGELDQTTENEFSDSILIRDENEMLRNGEVPAVLITDNHAEHVVGHKGIMSSPEARQNPLILEAWIKHVSEHIDKMRQVPPDLAAVLSGQPLPPTGAPPPPAPQQPDVNGVNMPSLPGNAPQSVQDNYQQVLNSITEQSEGEF
jgi:hypothetical protein